MIHGNRGELRDMSEQQPKPLFGKMNWPQTAVVLAMSGFGGGVGGGVGWFSSQAVADRLKRVEELTVSMDKDNAVRDLRMASLEQKYDSLRLESYAEMSKVRDRLEDVGKILARIEATISKPH